jgi:hypothetical protein
MVKYYGSLDVNEVYIVMWITIPSIGTQRNIKRMYTELIAQHSNETTPERDIWAAILGFSVLHELRNPRPNILADQRVTSDRFPARQGD